MGKTHGHVDEPADITCMRSDPMLNGHGVGVRHVAQEHLEKSGIEPLTQWWGWKMLILSFLGLPHEFVLDLLREFRTRLRQRLHGKHVARTPNTLDDQRQVIALEEGCHLCAIDRVLLERSY